MLASGSLASAPSAASMIAWMLRSACARRLRADASVFVFVFAIGSVDRHRLRVERQLGEEVLGTRENRQRKHAGEASAQSGDQECVADPGGCLRAEDCSAP